MKDLKKLGLLGALTYLTKSLKEKGVFALIQFQQEGDNTTFSTHVDFNKSEYDDVVSQAHSIKHRTKEQ